MSPTAVISRNQSSRDRITTIELTGFLLAIAAVWVTEIYDPPFQYQQCLIMTGVIGLLGAFTVHWTRHMLRTIRYLEGFMVICAACKKARIDQQWVPIDQVIHDQTELQLSHGICPECAQRLYGDILNTPLAKEVS